MAHASRSTSKHTPHLHTLASEAQLYQATAQAFADIASEAITARGRFTVALAGGSTPRGLYEQLAAAYRDTLAWPCMEIFFGDERCVPPDDPASNYHMARLALLDHVPIPADNIHRMRGEDEPHAAARGYTRELRKTFGSNGNWPPRFDLILLGMGANGHTASLFPGTGALRERRRIVYPQYVEVQQQWRLTLTLPTINAARAVWVLVKGRDKAATVARVLHGPSQPEVLPIQSVAPEHGDYIWWLDEAAAGDMNREC